MNKWVKRFLIIDFVIFALLAGLVMYFLKSMQSYKPRTYEQVFQNKDLLAHYGIGTKRNPGDYGYKYQNVVFRNNKDNLQLHAWYIPAKNVKSRKVIFLIHGRQACRLKPMKYLALFKKYGFDKDYNIFLPDFRNSGISPEAKTAMGYKFAEDIMNGMLFLHKRYKTKEFVFYSFSMGSMASMIFLNRDDLQRKIAAKGLKVTKLIMDSPLANVKQTVYNKASSDGIPSVLVDLGFVFFNFVVDGMADRMKYSSLMTNVKIPVLVLQGGKDNYTPIKIFRQEIQAVKLPNIKVKTFPEAKHVVLWINKKYTAQYEKVVSDFLSDK